MLDKFRNKNCRRIFKNLRDNLMGLDTIRNIRGYTDIYDCHNSIIYKSKFNFKICYHLLELIFYHILDSLLELSNEDRDIKNKGKNKKKKQSISLGDDDEEEPQFSIGTSNSVVMSNYVFTLLKLIEKDRNFTNKYSQNLVDKNIKTRNEESKDRNLHVMELLDLETRRLRNEQTKAGLTKYADLILIFKNIFTEKKKIKFYGKNIREIWVIIIQMKDLRCIKKIN